MMPVLDAVQRNTMAVPGIVDHKRNLATASVGKGMGMFLVPAELGKVAPTALAQRLDPLAVKCSMTMTVPVF